MNKLQTTREEGLAIIASWKSSGKTSREFCEEQNIAYHRLQYWHGVYKREQGGSKFKTTTAKFIPIILKSEDSGIPGLEIHTPTGYSVKVFQTVNLTELISFLK
ncbi:MAG: hypothetical protein SH818_13230 [Saprospiraceae bacterium]|nr:hypothetical protein [Saprospiraceae bacterium]